MFTQIHNNFKRENVKEMKDAVYEHLLRMNVAQLYKEQKVITDSWLAICGQTAKDDLDKIIADGNLRTYYKRLSERAV